MPRWPLFGKAAAVAMLCGVCACLFAPRLLPWWWSIIGVVVAAALGWKSIRSDSSQCANAMLVACVALFGICCAGLHASFVLHSQWPRDGAKQEVIVRGIVQGLPQPEPRRTRFRFEVEDARAADGKAPIAELQGKTLQLAWYDDFGSMLPGPRTQLHAGSRWQFRAVLKAPRGLRNPGGFDSEQYAFAQRIAATGYLREPRQASSQQAKQLAPAQGIDAWREAMSQRIAGSARPQSARFIRALTVGDTSALDDGDWQTLRAAGLTHLIAISGSHVGLVGGFLALGVAALWWLFPALGRRVPRPVAAAIAALCGAASYAALTGFSLPTVRTLLMIAALALACVVRRGLRVGDGLALALIAVLLFDPLSVLLPGFWLSFAGVAWLAWCLPRGEGTLFEWRGVQEFLSAQWVATLGLLPLGVLLFGQASLVGPLANLVAIPWWSFVVVPLSLVGTLLETLHAGFGAWAWKFAGLCFEPTWSLFSRMAQSKLALLWLPEAPWFALPLAALGAFWLLLPRGVAGKSFALLLWLPLLWPNLHLPKDGEAQLQVIDVGQGLSVLVRTQHHALLYDTGPAIKDGYDAGERAVLPTLHALGIAALDRIVVSHGDNDHAGGLASVRAALPVGDVLTSHGAPVAASGNCIAGNAWEWDGVRFRFLHPPPDYPYLDNESSCVLRVETKHGAALLTGDIGQVIERELLQLDADALRSEVVLVPHHGSGGSSDAGFIAATGAKLALVSAGHDNRFGHPRAEVVRRWQQAGAEVLDTAQSGAVTVWLDADRPAVRERRVAWPHVWDAVAAPR